MQLLVANLSRAEKAELFASNASSIERIGWPKYNWWSESLHGIARDGMATSFPQIGLVACSMKLKVCLSSWLARRLSSPPPSCQYRLHLLNGR